MLEREIKVNGLYKHFKGTYHKVICIAKDSEDKSEKTDEQDEQFIIDYMYPISTVVAVVVCLLLFGKDQMVLTSMILILLSLFVYRNWRFKYENSSKE